MVLVRHEEHRIGRHRQRENVIKNLEDKKLHLRAAVAIEKLWFQRRAPDCPHCNNPLLPEDILEASHPYTSGTSLIKTVREQRNQQEKWKDKSVTPPTRKDNIYPLNAE